MSKLAMYLSQARQLLPSGRIWNFAEGSKFAALIRSWVELLVQVDNRAEALAIDANPSTSVELLPDWERTVGLPDPCRHLPPTVGERQALVVAKLAYSGNQSIASMKHVVKVLTGYEIEIEEHHNFQVGMSAVGDPVGGDALAHTWTVHIPFPAPRWFRSDVSVAGDTLATFGVEETIVCMLEAIKPAHTVMLVQFDLPYTGYAPWPVARPSAGEVVLSAPPAQVI